MAGINILGLNKALTGQRVWFFIDQIACIECNELEGNAVICTTDGKRNAVAQTPDEVFARIDAALSGRDDT
jgi:hypothetical protein